MLLHRTDIDPPKRLSRPEKQPDAPPAKSLEIMTSHGGTPARAEFVQMLLQTGRFDDIAREYVRGLDSGEPESMEERCVLTINGSEEMQNHLASTKSSRAIAETKKSSADVYNDPNINASSQTLDGDDVDEMLRML